MSSSRTFETVFPVRDYDLAATLDSGQVFRWRRKDASWTGVVGKHWVRLTSAQNAIRAQTHAPREQWDWLRAFLQTRVDLAAILETFPGDPPMRAAVAACRGLRLLRQEPWECLASFILSSTKQIVQIRQIIAQLCDRFGEPVAVPSGEPSAFAFPPAEKIAGLSESELRACKAGFRAPYLLATAVEVASGRFNLKALRTL
ncbi:MAG: DNA-3-methyladenine glycosylase 2 family protein, partial [Verrucomicrobia bacterium]|nr:DNA-3-methyladenine glycosylase 2 family protein [Verrucomicrobiota bacterium]